MDRDKKKKFAQKSNASKIRVLVVEGYFLMAGLVSKVSCGLVAKEPDLLPNAAEGSSKAESLIP